MPLVDSSGMIDAAVPESPGSTFREATHQSEHNQESRERSCGQLPNPTQRRHNPPSPIEKRLGTREVSLEDEGRMSGAELLWIR